MESGLPRFIPDFTCPALLGYPLRRDRRFAYGAFTRSGRPFHAVRLRRTFVTAPKRTGSRERRPHDPTCSNALKLTHAWV